jgi:UDP-GlcNAc:undecaprenyl-phosphate/decaprenyl-phosphate GlcNAc-1-phosphate transferase
VMCAIGMRDDRSHLSPFMRLVATVGVFLPVILLAPDFRLEALHFAGVGQHWALTGITGVVFTLICLVGLLNAINMADGKNGIVTGMALVWTAVLAVYAPPMLWPALAATGAALAVVLAFNMAGKLFLGDGGSYAVSALFGLLAIFVYNSAGSTMAADDVALLFAVPVFDTIRLMVARFIGGRSPFDGDRDHLHHHIHARLGWPHGLAVYIALVAVPNAGSMLWHGTSLLWLALTFVAYAGVIVAMRVPQAQGSPAE